MAVAVKLPSRSTVPLNLVPTVSVNVNVVAPAVCATVPMNVTGALLIPQLSSRAVWEIWYAPDTWSTPGLEGVGLVGLEGGVGVPPPHPVA